MILNFDFSRIEVAGPNSASQVFGKIEFACLLFDFLCGTYLDYAETARVLDE